MNTGASHVNRHPEGEGASECRSPGLIRLVSKQKNHQVAKNFIDNLA